jgi:hypothetical protein
MAGVIALCENPKCKVIFEHHGIIGGSGIGNIEFIDTKIGPCPNCGGFGRVPNGIYNLINDTLTFIKGPQSSIETLQSIEKLLRSFKNKNLTKDDVLKEIETISPEVAKNFKNTSLKIDSNQWINTLISLITVIILIQQSYFKNNNDDEIKDKFIEHLLLENKELQNKKSIPIVNKTKIGRNDPCFCGSNIKYKKCHLIK